MAEKILNTIKDNESNSGEFSTLIYYPQKNARCAGCGEMCKIGDKLHQALHLYCQETIGIKFTAVCYRCFSDGVAVPISSVSIPVVSKLYDNECGECKNNVKSAHECGIAKIYLIHAKL